jgi:prepilin-type N-terminal cleavage/methylation domain-containing protein
MRTRNHSSGFTLIEVLISMAIFAVGSLGVLAMVTTTLRLNVNSRQTLEANQLAIRQAERLQILAAGSAELDNCTMLNRCYLTPALTSTNVETTVSPSDLLAPAAGSGLRYEVVWRVGPAGGAGAPRYVEVKVYWPKNRDLASALWETPSLNCQTTGGSNCYSTQVFTYRSSP